MTQEELNIRSVDFLDICKDHISEHKYKESEDPKKVKSKKADRGPLSENWKEEIDRVMCSYKIVRTKFEVWGLQTKVEAYAQKVILFEYFNCK